MCYTYMWLYIFIHNKRMYFVQWSRAYRESKCVYEILYSYKVKNIERWPREARQFLVVNIIISLLRIPRVWHIVQWGQLREPRTVSTHSPIVFQLFSYTNQLAFSNSLCHVSAAHPIVFISFISMIFLAVFLFLALCTSHISSLCHVILV